MVLNQLSTYKFCPNCSHELDAKTIDGQSVKACSDCGFIFWNNPKPVVSFIAHKNDKVLMLQRAKEPLLGYWVLPGGFINYGETAQEAALRETAEETGLSISIERIVGAYLIDNDPRGVHIDIIFAGQAAGDIKLNNENGAWHYFKTDKLPENIAYKHRRAIADWCDQAA